MASDESLCPRCLRPAVLLDRGQDVLGAVSIGIITRTRADDGYCCHGCGAEFAEPFRVRRAALEDHRARIASGASNRKGDGE